MVTYQWGLEGDTEGGLGALLLSPMSDNLQNQT